MPKKVVEERSAPSEENSTEDLVPIYGNKCSLNNYKSIGFKVGTRHYSFVDSQLASFLVRESLAIKAELRKIKFKCNYQAPKMTNYTFKSGQEAFLDLSLLEERELYQDLLRRNVIEDMQ